MECKFFVGQRVLAIEDCQDVVITGETYVIERIVPHAYDPDTMSVCHHPHVALVGIGPGNWLFEHQWFRPLDDASLNWAREMCAKSEPRITVSGLYGESVRVTLERLAEATRKNIEYLKKYHSGRIMLVPHQSPVLITWSEVEDITNWTPRPDTGLFDAS